MTNQIRDQKPQATNLITVTACGFSSTQKHSTNNSCVHDFWIRTVIMSPNISCLLHEIELNIVSHSHALHHGKWHTWAVLGGGASHGFKIFKRILFLSCSESICWIFRKCMLNIGRFENSCNENFLFIRKTHL